MRLRTFLALAIFAAAFFAYIRALNVGFYSDDYGFTPLFILTPGEMWTVIQRAHQGLLNLHPFRPTAFLVFLLDYRLHGFDPVGFHLTNILIHSLNSVLFFYLLKAIFKNDWTAFIAALFFAVYPVNIESVVWVSGRFDLLASFFLLIALLLWIEGLESDSRRWLIPMSALIYLLALFAKETVIAAVLIFPVFIVCYGKGKAVTNRNWLLLSALAVLIFIAARYWMFGNIAGDTFSTRAGLEERLDPAFMLSNLWEDIVIAATPFNRETNNPVQLYFYISYGIVLLASVINFATSNRDRFRCHFTLGALWFLAFILPALIMDGANGELGNSRFLYLPSMGIGWIFSMSVRGKYRILTYISAVALVFSMVLNVITLQNNIAPWVELTPRSTLIDKMVANEIEFTRGSVPKGLILVLVNIPMYDKGVHLAPVPYNGYLDFLNRTRIKTAIYTGMDPGRIESWYEQLKSGSQPYLVFVYDESTDSFRPY